MAKGPSALNLVTLLLLLAVGALAYGAWKFLPVYLTAAQVDHALSEGASRAYSVSHLGDPVSRTKAKDKLVAQLRSEVVALGVTDPEMTLSLELVGDNVEVSCDYRAAVVHPFVDRYTLLNLHRRVSQTLKPSGL